MDALKIPMTNSIQELKYRVSGKVKCWWKS